MQQINLYLPEFRPNREPLRSVHMVWILVALIVLLALYSLYSSQRNSQLREQIATEQSATLTVQAQLQQLSLQQPANSRAQLERELVQLQAERSRRQQLLTIISRKDLGNTSGFSSQLQTLARQSLESIALNRFSLQQGGRYVEFSGTAHSADQVPVYIQNLRTEESFARVGFGVMRVERDKGSVGPLTFSLTKAEEKDVSNGAGDYFEGDKVGDKAQ